MTLPPEERDDEELEHIPWSMLAGELDTGRSRTMVSLVIAVVAVVVVVFVGMRTLRRTTGTVVEIPSAPPASTVAAPAPALEPGAPASPAPSDTLSPDVAAPSLYAEADLMAVAPEQEQRLAATHAEWLVTDYFTVDDVAAGEPALWVEWARTTEVVPVGPATYDVAVMFSTLARDAGGVYSRAGPRAVRIPIELAPDGPVALDLPTPFAAPARAELTPPPIGNAQIPDEIGSAATEAATVFGVAATVDGGSVTDNGWRVVVTVEDATGLRFPLVVHVGG